MLACALSVVQRVPDFAWRAHELLYQRKGGVLQSGLFQVGYCDISQRSLKATDYVYFRIDTFGQQCEVNAIVLLCYAVVILKNLNLINTQ